MTKKVVGSTPDLSLVVHCVPSLDEDNNKKGTNHFISTVVQSREALGGQPSTVVAFALRNPAAPGSNLGISKIFSS